MLHHHIPCVRASSSHITTLLPPQPPQPRQSVDLQPSISAQYSCLPHPALVQRHSQSLASNTLYHPALPCSAQGSTDTTSAPYLAASTNFSREAIFVQHYTAQVRSGPLLRYARSATAVTFRPVALRRSSPVRWRGEMPVASSTSASHRPARIVSYYAIRTVCRTW